MRNSSLFFLFQCVLMHAAVPLDGFASSSSSSPSLSSSLSSSNVIRGVSVVPFTSAQLVFRSEAISVQATSIPNGLASQNSFAGQNGLASWVKSVKDKIAQKILERLDQSTDDLDQYTECAEVAELPGAILCCSFYQKTMNDTFTRAGIFMGAGKGFSEGTLLPHTHPTLINYKKLVAGHNLPGEVILSFFKKLNTKVSSTSSEQAEIKQLEAKLETLEANDAETAFYKNLVQSQRVKSLGKRFYVIGFAIQNMKTYPDVVTHELHHAQFALDLNYQKIVKKFWKDFVSPGDQSSIRAALGKAYNIENVQLLIDEFQAYLLQSQAKNDRMSEWVDKYQKPLIEQLLKANVSPSLFSP